jgi:hypothetical protein
MKLNRESYRKIGVNLRNSKSNLCRNLCPNMLPETARERKITIKT